MDFDIISPHSKNKFSFHTPSPDACLLPTLILDFCNGLLENHEQTTRLELENLAKARLYYRVRPQGDIPQFSVSVSDAAILVIDATHLYDLDLKIPPEGS